MTNKLLWMILMLVTAGILPAASTQQTIVGQVVKVADADTITVYDGKQQHKIRLEGIDAPERGQAFGAKATAALKGALGDGRVVVTVVTTDRYGRIVGRVHAGDTDVNAWLVANGWAWHYKHYSKDHRLAELERSARNARRGLWADPSTPVAPWDYRSSKRSGKPMVTTGTTAGAHWLNTSSGVRHNARCRHFGKTSRGRLCDPDAGRPCGICGG